MKTKIYIFAIIVSFFAISTYPAYSSINIVYPMQLYAAEDGTGKGGEGGGDRPEGKPRADASLITAIVNEKSNIELLFNSDIGNINIEIKNAGGLLIYKSAVNTSNTYEKNIAINALTKGTYKISFTTTSGSEIIYGDFTID